MRIAASLMLLAGCDVLFGLQDVRPPPADATDAPLIDAAEPDAPPIAPMHCALPNFTAMSIGGGTFYTVDAAVTTAVFEDNNKIWLTPAGSTIKNMELFAGMNGLRAPRLGPTGSELFMIYNQPVCCSLVASMRDAMGVWSMPVPITIQNVSLGNLETPGIPSLGMGAKRRMIVTNATQNEFFELREDEAGWTQVFNYRAQTIGMAEMQDANLSPDGYRLYFAGVRMGGTNQKIFMAERTDLTKAFERASIVDVHDTGQNVMNVRTPYVSDDCTSLWFSIGTGTTSTVYKATPQ